jgi:V/A-type H+-transporting ATPase subunit E
MDFLSKDALLKYFQQAITKESQVEIDELRNEINQLKSQAKAAQLLELHEIETRKKYQQQLVALTREYDLKLMRLRQDLLNKLFDELTDYLKTFEQTKEYANYIKTKLSSFDLSKYDHAEINPKDDTVKSLLGSLKVVTKEDILGGFLLVSKDHRTVIDETFNSKLEDAKVWFYDHAEWFGE